MDSLTQAVLGAAVGEAVLGRKIGNKAIVWGAIAGTIPDLDVVSKVFINDEVFELIYHRGFTHSILFTILAAPLLGWLATKHRAWLSMGFYCLIWFLFAGLAFRMPNSTTLVLATALSLGGLFLAWKLFVKKSIQPLAQEPTWANWSWMFFWAILTHWFIDTCTSYGTQIFEPFSSYRVSFNNISIVDPLYTVPMLLALIVLAFFRNTKTRQIINNIGLGISTTYMAFTFYAKYQVDLVVDQNIKKQGIVAHEYVSSPTIFNAILWQTTIVSDSTYYYGIYSLLDKDKNIEFIQLPKNHELLDRYDKERKIEILKWFAQGYYNVIDKGDGVLQMNNLRFGLAGYTLIDLEDPYIFKFVLKEEKGILMTEQKMEDFGELKMNEVFSLFGKRIWGKENFEACKLKN